MPAYAIVGGQWGDEGKGKVVDALTKRATIVARFSGGSNAGHTVITPDGTFSFHLLPSGMCRDGVLNIIGNGVVVDIDVLLREINDAEKANLPGQVLISDRAHLVMPYHLQIDRLEEEYRGSNAIGTTGRGIGPAYVDKASRRGIRAGELLEKEALLGRVEDIVAYHNQIIVKIYGGTKVDIALTQGKIMEWSELLRDFIAPVERVIEKALQAGEIVIAEGAQGALLDIDHGTYPFVTSSNSTSGAAAIGLGIGPNKLEGVLGVFKSFCTRVGAGPFPTEMNEATADDLREHAGEFGVTTGRARRLGWFDAVAARYSTIINGLDAIVLTRLDTLDGRGPVKICIGYELDGKLIDVMPLDSAALGKCKPVYEELEGWNGDTAGARQWDKLPLGAQKYVRRLEELLEIPVAMISTGPERHKNINVNGFKQLL